MTKKQKRSSRTRMASAQRRSNIRRGSGGWIKSDVFEALYEALYGKIPSTGKDGNLVRINNGR